MRMRGGFLTEDRSRLSAGIYGLGDQCTRTECRRTKPRFPGVQSSAERLDSSAPADARLEELADVVQKSTFLHRMVRWVAGIRASVHTKLLTAFLIVAALFIVMALATLQTIVSVVHQSRLLDEAHELVALAQQGESALARQMHFTDVALLSQNEAAIARILRENKEFNDRLAKLEAAGTANPALVSQVRTLQDEAMAVVAD